MWRRNPISKSRRVRTPTLLQMEAVECGAASLGIVLGYYGRFVPLAELRQICGVSRDGTTLANIVRAAQYYGLNAKGFKKSLESLPTLRCPYIVFWNFNHFLVVEGFDRQSVHLNDPATGPLRVSIEEFDESFTGVILVMEPGPAFKPGGRMPSVVRALRARLKGSRTTLSYCLLAGLLLVFPGLLIPVFTQLFVDYILIQDLRDWLRPLLLGLLMTAVLRGALLHLQLRQLRRWQLKLSTVLSSKFLWHILHLPARFYAQRYAGEISQRTVLNDRVAEALSGRLATTIIDLTMMLIYACMMFYYDVVLTLIGVASAATNFLALQWLSRRRVDANMRMQHEFGKLGGVAIAGLQNIESLKASAMESSFFSRWSGYFAKAVNMQQNLGLTNQLLSVLPVLMSALTSMLVLLIGGVRVINGYLSLGMLIAFQSLMQSFLTPVATLVGLGSALQELRSDLLRLDDVLRNSTDERHSQSRATLPATINTFRLQGEIEVHNLTFGYSRVSPPLIEGLSFSLAPGRRLALVGSSGSGKSTVAKLLCGLYLPWEGEIRFDGHDPLHMPRDVLSESMAFVDQDLFLFAGSVRDNLTLWDETIPVHQLIQACRDAEIHDIIVALPGGYDSELLEGAANLSGGQRQRLEIARALVHRPAILVMDEATSALDAETEYRIMHNLRQRDCSYIIVAHRLSTIRDCDEIIVLEHGRVIQRGTHEYLLQQGGAYSRLLMSEGDT